MKNLLLLLTLTTLLSLTSGCSIFVASGGKKLDEVFGEKATRKSVEKQFGPSERFVNYEPPRPLSQVPEVLTFSAPLRPPDSIDWATSYGDYRYKGRIYDLGASQAAGMAFGMTFGVAEIFMFPASLIEAAQERTKEHFFRVWYSATGHCLAYLWRPAEKSAELPE